MAGGTHAVVAPLDKRASATPRQSGRPLRICAFTTSYPRHATDLAGRFVLNTVEHLRARGVEVDLPLALGAGIGLQRAPVVERLLPLPALGSVLPRLEVGIMIEKESGFPFFALVPSAPCRSQPRESSNRLAPTESNGSWPPLGSVTA